MYENSSKIDCRRKMCSFKMGQSIGRRENVIERYVEIGCNSPNYWTLHT
jgi:hypothetical protein